MLPKTQRTGTAAEYLVCFDLALKGLHAVPNVFEHCEYDVVADAGGKLIKIQVKGVAGPYRNYYDFDMRAGGRRGTRKRTYESVDLFAFVAVDQMKIIWCTASSVNALTKKTFTALAMAQGDDTALTEWLRHITTFDLKTTSLDARTAKNTL